MGNVNNLVRLAKISRIAKMIKLTKLLRILKVIKQRNQLLKYVKEFIKMGYGSERLMLILLIFILIAHIITCLWIFSASFADEYEGTWMEGEYAEMESSD